MGIFGSAFIGLFKMIGTSIFEIAMDLNEPSPPASSYYHSEMYDHRILRIQSMNRELRHQIDYQREISLRDVQNRIDELRNNRINYSSNNYSPNI
jgi:hypothetical protein